MYPGASNASPGHDHDVLALDERLSELGGRANPVGRQEAGDVGQKIEGALRFHDNESPGCAVSQP